MKRVKQGCCPGLVSCLDGAQGGVFGDCDIDGSGDDNIEMSGVRVSGESVESRRT